MKTTFYKAFMNGDHNIIMVPRLQRDYVQGSNVGVKTSFCQNLITAIVSKNQMDLNYIYGIYENNHFIPIDGQQRLTTLWILHLYVFAQTFEDTESFPIIEYETRDSARKFCKAIHYNLKYLIKNEELDIKEQPWYYDSWDYDTTVVGITATINYFHKYWKHKEKSFFKEKWDLLCSEDCPITFTFINNKEEHLNKDIYLKMNSRGRSLSEFEKLKSWLDEKLPSSKKSLWQEKIDNEWTNMIWQKRKHVKSVTGYEIDNIDIEQLRLIYNLLSIYWAQNITNPNSPNIIKPIITEEVDDVNNINIEKQKPSENRILEQLESVSDMLGFTPTKRTDASTNIRDFQRNILAKITVNNSFSIPLYILDKLYFTPADFFEKACEWYDSIYDYNSYIEQSAKLLHCGEGDVFYKYFLDPNHTYPDAVITYAILLFIDSKKKAQLEIDDDKFLEWIRVIRNIVFNSTIESVQAYIGAVNLVMELSHCLSDNYNYSLYKYLASSTIKSDFAKEQLKEEIYKASIIDSEGISAQDSIHKMENLHFFNGKIRFAFYCIDIDTKVESYNENKPFANNKRLFDSIYEIVKESINDKEDISYRFRRILFACGNHRFYNYYSTYSWSLELDKRVAIKNTDELKSLINLDWWIPYLKEAILNIIIQGGEKEAIEYLSSKDYEDTPNWIIRLIKEENLLKDYCNKNHYFAVERDDSACLLFKGAQRPKSKNDCFIVN